MEALVELPTATDQTEVNGIAEPVAKAVRGDAAGREPLEGHVAEVVGQPLGDAGVCLTRRGAGPPTFPFLRRSRFRRWGCART
jgi:hypothetical protein